MGKRLSSGLPHGVVHKEQKVEERRILDIRSWFHNGMRCRIIIPVSYTYGFIHNSILLHNVDVYSLDVGQHTVCSELPHHLTMFLALKTKP